MSANDTLRLLRERLNLSIQDVANAAGVSFRTVLRAEQGAPLNPDSRRQLCTFYGKTSPELGLVPRRRRTETQLLPTNCKRTRLTSLITQRGDKSIAGTEQEQRQQAIWSANALRHERSG
jgi:transcriptional regulator with XRE-family HTH domain